MKLEDHVADWLDDAIAWWLAELGPAATQLALPDAGQFPRRTPDGVLASVLAIADLNDWKFELVDESDATLADPLANMPRPAGPVPVLSVEDDVPIAEGGPYPISYTHELAADPAMLIASIARDVSHYLLYAASEDPPGDDEQRQIYVEVGAVMLGFGVFLANTAVRFQQVESGGLHGWSRSVQGELGEDALGYLLAVFVTLADGDPTSALGHLTANPKAAFKWAHQQLQGPRRDTIEQLRDVVRCAGNEGPYR
jgi:hypothetical protein